MFKIKDWYKLELQMPETMKLVGRRKKNRQNKTSFEVAEVDLV